MKGQIRLLGIDDSPFTFNEQYVKIIGVIMRGGEYIECVLSSQVIVDGRDSTQVIIDMIKNTRHNKQIRAILIDGVALGGFNIIDAEEVYKKTNFPIITVTRDEPDFNKIKKALKNHFVDWESRWELISKGELYKIKTKHNPIFVKCWGLTKEEAKEIINLSTIRGVIPEPIRVAHLIASGISRGESYGKA
jgi:hypothetical protein